MSGDQCSPEAEINGETFLSGHGNDAYYAEVITDYGALCRLQPVWNLLLKAAGIDHPFLSHEWITSWWQCFGTGKSLYIVLIKSRDSILGIMPLMVSREWISGVRVRRLGSIYNPHTPRSDFIVSANKKVVYTAFWEHLVSNSGLWDVLELCQFPEDSIAMAELISHAKKTGYRFGKWRAAASPYLPISGNWDGFLNKLGTNHRSNIKRQIKKLGEIGTPALETINTDVQIDDALAEGFRIEAIAWKGAAGTAIAVQPVLKHFYTIIAKVLAKQRCLRLHFLSVNGRRIAFQYCLLFRNKIFLLKPGYDPEYARYSPSNLLTGLILQDAFRTGITEYDFLGQDDYWKLKWTRRTRQHLWLYVFSENWRGVLLNKVKFSFIPVVKKLKGFLIRRMKLQRFIGTVSLLWL